MLSDDSTIIFSKNEKDSVGNGIENNKQRYLGLIEFNEKERRCVIDLIDTTPEKLIDRHFIEDMANEIMAILHKEIYGFSSVSCTVIISRKMRPLHMHEKPWECSLSALKHLWSFLSHIFGCF